MKKNSLSIILTFLLSGVVTPVSAAPVVNAVAGSWIASQSVSVVGSGFGTKAAAGPMMFGDFENAINGQPITSSGPSIKQGTLSNYLNWRTSGPNSISINSVAPVDNSTKHARVTFPSSSAWYSFVSVPYQFSTAGQKLYISFDYKHSISGQMPRQSKALIYYNAASADRLYMSTAYDRCESGGWRLHVTQGGGDTGLNTSGPAINNEWVRLENYIVQSGVNLSNGTWIGAIIRGSNIDSRTRTGVFRTDSTNWTQMAIGGAYYDMCGSSDPGTIDVDNIYIDNTPQRVEVGNAPTWAATTYREILIPTEWSDTSITATVRLGRFKGGQTAYVYIVDSAGMVNNNGYPIIIGGGGSGTIPPSPVALSAPKGLRISN